jgi:hypothetical protein
MGLDFIRRAARTFTKSWSRGAAELAQPTLFTRYPECRSRSVVAALENSASVEVGIPLAVHVDGPSLALVRETTRVGTVSAPPHDLLAAIQGAGGCAMGRISQLNPLSGTAHVEIE